ncbi:hypothetical protein EJ05DRAFT_488727 [Pseudovirgaria hyperparasitica]|uniref:Uncharacterized protein n=1 Tax=Pseudovirgaria hyperparasitica TaxID=470096 RepID=A0A6A6VZ94_9PEZI|nr:uncharacterized protein EJ05DRAFT_488727 [Pseudovirgaria hyperparasitica]KAF2755199.1 hypothetical protein EJ05DRAFT_488727 [Pseudovirgaria hyperparasitica]
MFSRVEQYPWDEDEEFQGGLTAILGSSSSPEQAAELTLRARCFYFSRKFSIPVDFDAYKRYRESANLPIPNGVFVSQADSVPCNSSTPTPNMEGANGSTQPDAPYPTSFAEIVELITSGKPIPGIKDIPPTVLEGQGTQAVKPRRKKPWEKDDLSPPPAMTSEATQEL